LFGLKTGLHLEDALHPQRINCITKKMMATMLRDTSTLFWAADTCAQAEFTGSGAQFPDEHAPLKHALFLMLWHDFPSAALTFLQLPD